MSIGFRIFLLILFGFGTVYAYRFRATDLNKWLSEPHRLTAPETPPQNPASPVNVIPAADVALIWLKEPVRLRSPSIPQETDRWDEARDGDYYLPSEEVGAEDLALMDPPLAADGDSPLPLAEENELLVATGDVSESGESPRAASVASEEILYTVKAGDNLWKIAEQHLGAGFRHREIFQLNRGLFQEGRSDAVTPGMQLRIRVSARETVLGESLKIPGGPADSSVEKSSPSGSRGPQGESTYHTVRRDENLRKIASLYFPGKIDGWERIFEANRDLLDSADRIRAGQVLTIPSSP